MELNTEIFEVLKDNNIDKSQGMLCLLAIYFGLDVNAIIPEEIIKGINITKIVVKDYKTNSITWNMPLFAGQQTEWDWVKDWVDGFGKINPDRKGSWQDATTRMKEFFGKYPRYRVIDVFKARDLYFQSNDAKSGFLMKSHKFIFEGVGASKTSTLLAYCERVAAGEDSNQQKGKVIK